MKKRYSYYLARSLITITGVIFITQFIFEFFGLINRKSGFEWVIYICGAAFLLALIYGLILIILNKKVLKKTIMRDNYLNYIPCI
jgi:bacteriorhodopsin